MASIIQDPGGKKRLQFTIGGGRRVTIRLGKLEMRHADSIRMRVEALYASKTTGCSPDPETTRWVATLGTDFHDRLAQAGLVTPRDQAQTTLGGLLDTYFATINVKPGTAVCYKQARRSLEDYFGPNRDLKSISALDAEKFRQALKDEGLAEPTISKRIKVSRQVFKKAVKWKMIAENPFAEVARASRPTNRGCSSSRKQTLRRCWKPARTPSGGSSSRCRGGAGCGAPASILPCGGSDIDWVRGRVTVWSCKTAGLRRRGVPAFAVVRRASAPPRRAVRAGSRRGRIHHHPLPRPVRKPPHATAPNPRPRRHYAVAEAVPQPPVNPPDRA